MLLLKNVPSDLNAPYFANLIKESSDVVTKFDGCNLEENEGLVFFIDLPLIMSVKGMRLESTDSHFMLNIKPIYNLCLQVKKDVDTCGDFKKNYG
jgi:hypothetical protein